jgi:hypothetical protein
VKYLFNKGSTKNVLIILVAIGLVGTAFFVAEYRNKKSELVFKNNPVEVIRDNNLNNSVDWQSILEANDISTTSKSTDLTIPKEKLNSTDLLGRDFFAKYMELRQTGYANDKAGQEDLVGQVIQNGVMLASPKEYSIINIKTINDDGSEAIRKYANDAGLVFKTYSISSRNEAVIAKDALDKENPAILKELDPIIKSYKNILNGLLAVKAPQSMSKMHVDLINSVSSLVFIVEKLRVADVDPLAGVQAVARYTPTVQLFADAIINIKNKLISLGVKYTANESGTFFIPN